MQTIKFKINNITCPACVTLSINALSEIAGVVAARVDLATGEATIESTQEISPIQICEALAKVDKEVVLP